MSSPGPDVKQSDPDVTEADPAVSRFRRILLRFRRLSTRALLAGGLLGLLLVGALQPNGVSTWIANRLADRFNPYPGTRLTVDRVSGSWVRSLRLEGVRLTPAVDSESGGPEISLDTLALRFRLLPLLVRKLDLREAVVTGLEARLTQRPDSLWDFLVPFRTGDKPAGEEEGGSGFRFRSGPIRIRDSAGRLTFAQGDPSEAPDRLEVEDLTLVLSRLELGEGGLSVIIDTLYTRFLPPGEALDRVILEGSGSLADGRMVVPGLSLQSGLSDVSAEGTLFLPREEEGEVEDIDFHLNANPLAFRDLSGFLRTLDPAASAEVGLRIRGRASLVEVSGEATLSSGGRMEVEGAFTPSPSGPVEYRVQATIADLGLESFLGRGPVGGQVDGEVTVGLEGGDLAHLTGDLSARVEGLLLKGRETRALVVSGTFLDGEAKLEGQGGTDEWGALRLSAGGRPLDPDPTLDLRGSFLQGPSIGNATGNLLEQTGFRDLEAGFSLRTEGFSVDSSSGEVEVETRGGAYRDLSLAGGALTASWREGTGTFALTQPLGEGRVATRGEVTWGEDPQSRGEARPVLGYSLTDLDVQGLDLSRLLGDTLPSRVNAQASLAGVGTDLRTLRATGELRLRDSEFRGLVLDSALARPTLEAGALSAFVTAWLGGSLEEAAGPETGGDPPGEMRAAPGNESAESGEPDDQAETRGGRLLATLQGRPFDPDPVLTLDSLVFNGIDLASLAGLPTSLNGIVRARMEGLDPRTDEFSGEIALSPSRIRDTSVESGEGVFSLSEGDLRISGEFLSPDGTIHLTAGASPFAESARFRLEEGEIRGLNLGPFLGQEGLESDLNLSLSLSGAGSSPQELEATGEIVLLPSSLNGGTIQGGTIALGATGGRGTASGDIRTGEGELTLQVIASLGAGLEDIRVESDLDIPDLGPFLDRGETELEARGNLVVTWALEEGLEFASELGGRIGEATVDSLSVRGFLGDAVLRLDTLRVRSEILEADGTGHLALRDNTEGAEESDLMVTAAILDLAPLGPLLGVGEMEARSGGATIQVTGPPGTPSILASLDLGPWKLKKLSGDSARVTVDYGGEDLTLTVWIQEPEERGVFDLELWADPRPQEMRGILNRLDISTLDDHWALENPVPFSWKDGSRIDGFVLSSGPGRISVDGSIDPRGDQDLVLEVEEASISAVTRMLGRADLTLVVDGQVAINGPAASPVVEGDLRLGLALRQDASTSVDANFSLAGGTLTLGAQASDPAGGVLTLDGSLPMAFSLAPRGESASSEAGDPNTASPDRGPVDLTLHSEAFDISWVPAVLPPGTIAGLEGILSADFRATGPLDQPVLEGRMGLAGGMVRLAASGTRYQDIDLSAELRDQDIRITRASATSGGGTAEIQGSIGLRSFKPEELNLTARLDRFLAWSTPRVDAKLTGSLSLEGSVQEPRLAGSLNLEGSKISLDDVSAGSEVKAVELTEEDYQMLEEYFDLTPERGEAKPSRLLERFGLSLALSFDRDVWVDRSRQPRLTLEMRGDLEVEKDPMGPVRVAGRVETLPARSYFRQFGRRFSVQEGEVNLTGNPSEFSFRMDARWEVPSYSNPDEAEVVVNLEVVGDAETLELTLSSEPQMDESDIVSYLATGKPQSALGSSDADVAGLGTSMAVGAVAGVLEGIAGDAVELDVVEIKVDPVKGTTLIAGRYVSPNLYLGFRQPVTFSENSKRTRSENQSSEVEVEYRWFRWLTMNVQGGASELRVFLKARYAY